jgi:hypothetical protein
MREVCWRLGKSKAQEIGFFEKIKSFIRRMF